VVAVSNHHPDHRDHHSATEQAAQQTEYRRADYGSHNDHDDGKRAHRHVHPMVCEMVANRVEVHPASPPFAKPSWLRLVSNIRATAETACGLLLTHRQNHEAMPEHEHPGQQRHHQQPSLNRAALDATIHCVTGCAIGEVLGMILATWWSWGNVASIALAVGLAFLFGYSLTLRPVLGADVEFRRALRVAFASDTASITLMEIVDNAFILAVPRAIDAGLTDALFWWSLGVSLAIAFAAALPLNRWLISQGRGHAVVHEYHGH
jgi:hypothetical protein